MAAHLWWRTKIVSKAWRYGLAVISCAVALAVALPTEAAASCFTIAVVVSSLYGGRGPGILSVLLSALSFDYFILPPRHHFAVTIATSTRFAAFLIVIVLIAALMEAKRRVEESRRQIDAQYRVIADTSRDTILSIDDTGRIFFANPAAVTVFGWAESDLIGQPLNIIIPDFRSAEHATRAEFTGRRKDGTEFPFEVSFGELANGGRRTFTAFIRDISVRKRAEAALRKSELYLAEAQKLSKTGSFGWNTSTGELFWTPESFRVFGIDPGVKPSLEIVFDRIHPEDRAEVGDYLDRARQSGAGLDFEHRLLMPDGSVKHLHILARATSGEYGAVEYIGAAMDITARKQTEEAVRASELSLRLLVDSIPALVSIRTSDGEADMVNRQVMEYTGKTSEEMKNWLPTVHPDDRVNTANCWRRSLETGVPYDVEERIQRADGVYRWFHARGLPLRGSEGNIVRWYVVLTDIEDRKRAEEALRTSELNLRLMVDSIPALLTTTTPAGGTEMVNQQLVAYTGQTAEELKNWPAKLHPDDRARVAECWRRAIETGSPYDGEERIRRADGVYRWFHSRGLPMRDMDGRIIRWYVLLTDIEDRKRAQDALRASELNFRLMAHSIPGLLVTSTATGEVELVNQTLLNYTGRPLEELKNWPAVVHPGDLPAVESLWAHSVATGNPFDVDVRVCRADGVYRWFHCRGLPLRDNDGGIIRWYTLLTDIEDRINAEDALRTSERELSLIIETIPALVWSAGPGGEVTYMNRRVVDYTGAALETLARDGWTNFLHPEDLEPTLRVWSHAVATGGEYEVQYRLRRSDGAYRWFQAVGQLLRDGEGRVTRWYGLLIDIDDRKNTEEALRSTQARLSRATQTATLGELSASIAHEINQPLAAVVTNGHACLRWLTAEPPSLPKAREAAERIVRDGKEAGEVVRRIRALFRRAALEKVALDLNDVIGEVLRLLGGETTKRRVTVESELETALPAVVADRVQLQQLVLNLLINGLDAMDEVSDRPRVLSIRSSHCEDTALVEIGDSGVGLKDPDKIFEAFFTTKENGMGMGLTICRSIVEAHDGRLWASAAEGPGTIFHFTLPLKLSSAA
jgi:PAS domain S-box-containing protein